MDSHMSIGVRVLFCFIYFFVISRESIDHQCIYTYNHTTYYIWGVRVRFDTDICSFESAKCDI